MDEVRICNRGYAVPGGRGSLMVPNGDIYIGRGSNFPWREDYSDLGLFSSPGEWSFVLHELVHVFQYRNGNLNPVLMAGLKTKAWASGGYKYWPLTKSFLAHNIEQQAEMVQDRFRLSPGFSYLGVGRSDLNAGADYVTLNETIPVLQGVWVRP